MMTLSFSVLVVLPKTLREQSARPLHFFLLDLRGDCRRFANIIAGALTRTRTQGHSIVRGAVLLILESLLLTHVLLCLFDELLLIPGEAPAGPPQLVEPLCIDRGHPIRLKAGAAICGFWHNSLDCAVSFELKGTHL